MVEVWEDGEFIAAIYVAERGVKVVSKHKLAAARDAAPPNAVTIGIGNDEDMTGRRPV
jgi:hypothetical protein